jgi:thiamine-phosphate pyrophosphorylase
MEGLRITEEIARFILESKSLTSKIKLLRNKTKRAINAFSKKDLLSARNSILDVGSSLYTKEEKNRNSMKSIFKSNIKRAEEAFRVLEEFSKLVNSKIGKQFKDIRFEVYDLEKIIEEKLSC